MVESARVCRTVSRTSAGDLWARIQPNAGAVWLRYYWIEFRIDWARPAFYPDITDFVLFGSGTLQRQYLQCGGHIQHFFDRTRRADLGLEWLRQYPKEDAITNRILSGLAHLCLRQIRLDILRTIRREIRPDAPLAILDDQVQFCRQGLSAILNRDMTAVTGHRTSFKNPHQAVRAYLAPTMVDNESTGTTNHSARFINEYMPPCNSFRLSGGCHMYLQADLGATFFRTTGCFRILRHIACHREPKTAATGGIPLTSKPTLMAIQNTPRSTIGTGQEIAGDQAIRRSFLDTLTGASINGSHGFSVIMVSRQPICHGNSNTTMIVLLIIHQTCWIGPDYPVRHTRRIIMWNLDKDPAPSIADGEFVQVGTHIARPTPDLSSDEVQIESNAVLQGQKASSIDNEPFRQPIDLQVVTSGQLRLQEYESHLQREFQINQQMEQYLATLRRRITYGREKAFGRCEMAQLQSSMGIQGFMTLSNAPLVAIEVQPTLNLSRLVQPAQIIEETGYQISREMAAANHHRSQTRCHHLPAKRGRPPKYANQQDRLAANACRQRVKRQREAAHRRA